jgi:hypothetical protein
MMPVFHASNNRPAVSFEIGTDVRRVMVLKFQRVDIRPSVPRNVYPKDYKRLDAQLRPLATYAAELRDGEVWVDL